MLHSEQLDRDELAGLTNQLLDNEFGTIRTEAAHVRLSDWNRYLSDFYDHDESVYLLNA
jgi:hypothetical protein